ncbi:MAG: putative metal-binding motif-containing protein [Myxococcota bacterium]|nr:putative metal-binding motif-containing protein [Myxococcota bacterium]
MPRFFSFLFLFMTLACNGKDEGTDTQVTPGDDTAAPDMDGDGVPDSEDCDPEDPYTYPGANDIPYDGVDNDCAGDGDLTDFDGDGYDSVQVEGGTDCNDGNPTIFPGAPEVCYDDIDQDCAGDEDSDDCDGDGYDRFSDCNDEDASISPGVEEVWYDGIDQDCSGPNDSDYDADDDGLDHSDFGGGDCNDEDATVGQGESERWDGIDGDCDGEIDKMDERDMDKDWWGSVADNQGALGLSATFMSDLDGDGGRTLVLGSNGGWPVEIENLDWFSTGVFLVDVADASGSVTDVSVAHVPANSDDGTGWDLANLGDVDGDGIDDLVIGAPTTSSGGEVHLVMGSALAAGGEVNSVHATLTGNTYLGVDVTTMGDVDGDGVPEIVASEGWTGRTEVAVFGSTSWLSGGTHDAVNAHAVVESMSEDETEFFGGQSVGGLDFDGDGIGDLVVGDRTGLAAGVTGVIKGSDIAAGGILNLGDQVALVGWTGHEIGATQGWLSDLTGDGYDEVVVNASGDTPGLDANSGMVYVFDGDDLQTGSNAAGNEAWFYRVYGTQIGGRLQGAEKGADFDGDSVVDLILTHAGEPKDATKNATHIHFGADILAYSTANAADPTMDSDDVAAEFISKNQGTQLGYHALGEDIDGDGDTDLLLTAPFGQSSGGYIGVFFNALGTP